MPLSVYLGSLAIVVAVPLLWYAVAGARAPTVQALRVDRDRAAGEPANLRDLDLTRSASERVVQPMVDVLARRARRLTPVGMVESLERRILLAGQAARWPIERVLAVKLVLGVVGGLFALTRFAGDPSFGSLLFGVVVLALLYFAPDVLLRGRGAERQKRIQKELPDVLDQVTISVEAGLGFEAALAQAARSGKGPLSEELGRLLQDIQIGVSRGEALEALVHRTEAADLRHFVLAVRQAERYGIPIAQVLRVQSREMRDKRRQRAEEQAMKIPVKVVFPVVFCIFPALFVVILGPAMIQLWENFVGG